MRRAAPDCRLPRAHEVAKARGRRRAGPARDRQPKPRCARSRRRSAWPAPAPRSRPGIMILPARATTGRWGWRKAPSAANEDDNRYGKNLAEKYKNRKARQHASWGSHTLEDYTGNLDIKIKANSIGNALVPVPISLTSGPSGPVRKDLFKSLNWP